MLIKICHFIHVSIIKYKGYSDVAGYPNPIQIFPNVENTYPKKGSQNGGPKKGGSRPPPKMGVRTVKYTPFFGGYPPPRFIRVCSPSSPYEWYTDISGCPENDQKWPFLTPPQKPPFLTPFWGVPKKTPFFRFFSKTDSQILEASR